MDSIQTRRTTVMNVYVSFAGARRAQPSRCRATRRTTPAPARCAVAAVPASRAAAPASLSVVL